MSLNDITIKVSPGEALDKLSILFIKLDHIEDPEKIKNIEHEIEILQIDISQLRDRFNNYFNWLSTVNAKLWDVEDAIRRKELIQEFDEWFIALARDVYFLNDERAEIKRRINIESGSLIVEEKQYVEYAK